MAKLLPLIDVRAASPERNIVALLALNNAHEAETSLLDLPALQRLLSQAFMATSDYDNAALLIALDQDAAYESPNFLWFRSKLKRFVYVDRVMVASSHRGKGLARRLYGALFDAARASGHTQVACEVNVDPPNPISDAFHAALGFAEIGRAKLPNGRTVRYLVCDLASRPIAFV